MRQLLLKQDLRTVVGISVQAKDRVFGVLLLGTPDQRNFTPAELRLLLALGHQIGMAVENSFLVQQISRRSEELHLLNEVGTGAQLHAGFGRPAGAHLFRNATNSRRELLLHSHS